jgi:hypothetical protein
MSAILRAKSPPELNFGAEQERLGPRRIHHGRLTARQ